LPLYTLLLALFDFFRGLALGVARRVAQVHHSAAKPKGTSVHHQGQSATGPTAKYFNSTKTMPSSNKYIKHPPKSVMAELNGFIQVNLAGYNSVQTVP